jgi:hypothetical protein
MTGILKIDGDVILLLLCNVERLMGFEPIFQTCILCGEGDLFMISTTCT